jgi:hypothetical protein
MIGGRRVRLVGVDATRTWLIRLATVTGLGLLALAVYNALRTHQLACGPYRGACDLPPPTHPHLQLALLLAVAGTLILCGAALLAYLWRPTVVWGRRPDSRNEPSGGRTS